VRILGDAIHYVHAKDTQLYAANMHKVGVLDTKPYTQERDRSWMFRTVGYGHSAGMVERVHLHLADVWL